MWNVWDLNIESGGPKVAKPLNNVDQLHALQTLT